MAQAENIDSRLMNNNILNSEEEQNNASRELKKKQREDINEDSNSKEGGESETLREKTMKALRQKMKLEEKGKEKQKLEEEMSSPAKQGLSHLLKQAWLNLVDSFGLTLIWINIHIFLKWVFGGKFFCELGEEWLPEKIGQAGGRKAQKIAGKSIGIVEAGGVLLLDLLVGVIILGVLAIFLLICNIIQNPLDYIGMALKMFWNKVAGT
ncbi:MAG: hypothetical protein AAB530_00965 [Patescibacteria group bacterium]